MRRGFSAPSPNQEEAQLPAFRAQQGGGAQQQVEAVGAAVRPGVDGQRLARARVLRPPGRDLRAEKVEVRAVGHQEHRGGIGAVGQRRFRHALRKRDHGGGVSAGGVGQAVQGEPERRRAHPHGARQLRPRVADLEHEGGAAPAPGREGGQGDGQRRGRGHHHVPRRGQREGGGARRVAPEGHGARREALGVAARNGELHHAEGRNAAFAPAAAERAASEAGVGAGVAPAGHRHRVAARRQRPRRGEGAGVE
jgi:hypothetical protein